MRLELFEEDLRKSCENLATSVIGFGHLNPKAQRAVELVGKATFYRNKGTRFESYNVIYPQGGRRHDKSGR